MDLETSIIGIIIVAICILPFIIIGFNNSKKRKKTLQHLSDTAKNNNCTIEKSEFWHLTAIGIDQSNKMLFFTRRTDDTAIYKTIDLSQIQKVKRGCPKSKDSLFFAVFNLKYYLRVAQKTSNG